MAPFPVYHSHKIQIPIPEQVAIMIVEVAVHQDKWTILFRLIKPLLCHQAVEILCRIKQHAAIIFEFVYVRVRGSFELVVQKP